MCTFSACSPRCCSVDSIFCCISSAGVEDLRDGGRDVLDLLRLGFFQAVGDLFEPLAVVLNVAHQLGRQHLQRAEHLPIDVPLAIERRKREEQPVRIRQMILNLAVAIVDHPLNVVELMLHQAVGRDDRLGRVRDDRRLGGRRVAQLRFDLRECTRCVARRTTGRFPPPRGALAGLVRRDVSAPPSAARTRVPPPVACRAATSRRKTPRLRKRWKIQIQTARCAPYIDPWPARPHRRRRRHTASHTNKRSLLRREKRSPTIAPST